MKLVLIVVSLVTAVAVHASHPTVWEEPKSVVKVQDNVMIDVNPQGISRVQRFVETVEGKKIVCYYTDSYYTNTSHGGAGGISCIPLN